MNDFEQFVKDGAGKLTPAEIARFENELPLVLAKLNDVDPDQYPHLLSQAKFLVEFVEDCLDGTYVPNDVGALAEAIFALIYLHKGVDIIPDMIPKIGYSDDSAVVRTVISGHKEEFTKFGAKSGTSFDSLAA